MDPVATLSGILVAICSLFLLNNGALACDENQVKQCYSGIASQLGLPTEVISGYYLFSLINPTTNQEQQDTCTALNGFDFSAVSSCVSTAGCDDVSILPSDVSMPGMAVDTWSTVLDAIQGMCSPDCADYATIKANCDKCGQSMNSNDLCGGFSDLFTCYRNAIGSCELARHSVQSSLESAGVTDMISGMCPDINTDLSGSGNNNGVNPNVGGCNEMAAQLCFAQLGEGLGLGQEVEDMISPSSISSPEEINAQQQQLCNALAGHDVSSVRTCIQNSGCADTSLVPDTPGAPQITYTTVIDIIVGICEPGCENLGTMNHETELCSQGMMGGGPGSDQCSMLDDAFSCFRDAIGSCDVLVTMTEDILSSAGIMDMVSLICSDGDFSLSSGNKKRTLFPNNLKNAYKRLNLVNVQTRLNLFHAARNLHAASKRILSEPKPQTNERNAKQHMIEKSLPQEKSIAQEKAKSPILSKRMNVGTAARSGQGFETKNTYKRYNVLDSLERSLQMLKTHRIH